MSTWRGFARRGPVMIIEDDFRFPTLSLLAFQAGSFGRGGGLLGRWRRRQKIA